MLVGMCYLDPPEGAQSEAKIRSPESSNAVPPIECNGPAGVKLALPGKWQIRWLDVDEKYQIALEDLIHRYGNKQIEKANITIIVQYEPWWLPPFWPFRQTREFRFITRKLSDGRIYWTPFPLNR